MRPGSRWFGVRWVLLATLTVAACDAGPSGPGAFETTVTGEALGGVLLQVDGPGILGFEARGDARVYAAVDSIRPGRHRVLVITPGSGELRFGIVVEDVAIESPAITVLQATRADNRLTTPSAAVVRIVR